MKKKITIVELAYSCDEWRVYMTNGFLCRERFRDRKSARKFAGLIGGKEVKVRVVVNTYSPENQS